MASRWRTWDSDFFIDAHSSKMPEETGLIPAVGQGRGKPLKDIASLTLPKAALGITKEKNTAQAPATGRGRASVMKARALTDSPPVRRPGEKTTTIRTTVIDRLESFPPLSASNPKPPSPKWAKEQTKPKSSKGSATQTTAKSSVDEPMPNSTSPGVSKRMQEDLLSSTDGSDVIIIENFPSTINEQNQLWNYNKRISKKYQSFELWLPQSANILTEEERFDHHDDLVDLLKPYGDVLACIIERDSQGISLGTSLVRMESRNACEWIINTFNGEEYPGGGKPMVCRFLTDE